MGRFFSIRIHPWSFILLGFLSAIPFMKAAEDPMLEFEEAVHSLYEDLSVDFRQNEFFTKLRMNSLRDGSDESIHDLLLPRLSLEQCAQIIQP